MDIIRIKDLEVYANHGVLPEERILGQKFLISAVIYMDFSKAALSGNLDKTINYASVCQFISEFTQENTFELIETLAEGIALEVLDNFPLAERVDIEVKKPWAPIGLPVNTVSVEVSRSRHTVYIALGSNMGYKEGFLWGAVDALNALDDFKVTKVSDFIETEPYGGVEQDDFLNGVLEGETTMTPLQLLEALNNIEESAGRTRDVRWGPRTLDLDIIFYDDEIIDSEILVIPHKDMHRRDFVLAPMKQIAPWKRHPVTGKTIEEMYEEL
ncbi:MAG: 2-amino-4-hydroxy-6-hydroxymethyldihydropteridine diphosphokinase [Clostridiales bacterium]|nr:2-amino-4-hydroxy-6-hydroxymethyldihydropteridine diphosphokinase [Clostridiales bacterium]MDD7015494.1 2-amino-4-hydroxy-6-hydroxymethyldihydropteridine diphosphokinase [Bacillota bacterium]